jgi:isopentenyl diphosphate isomerase/L-lactate dehydrogenase-like FMN-dependent dehydrogenase
MQFAAKNTLSNASYAYYRTGRFLTGIANTRRGTFLTQFPIAALDEITYQANMLGWSKIRLLTSNLVDVSNANLKTSILGYPFNAPFFIAPAAQAGLASGGAESNLAKAAAAAGILYVPSISSTQSIETIGAAKANGQIMFHQASLKIDRSIF